VAHKNSVASVHDQIVDAVRSLASFLVSIKQLEPPEAAQQLHDSRVLAELAAEDRQRLLGQLAENAPYFFEHPDLDPDSDLVDKYLDDLAALHARLTPREASLEDTLDDVAAYLRRPPKKMHTLVEKQYVAALERRLPADAPGRRCSASVARAALDLLDGNESARFVYGPARLEWPEGERAAEPIEGTLWLLGVGERVILFSAGPQPRVLWRGARHNVHAESQRQLLANSLRVTGGQWLLNGSPQPLAFRLPVGIIGSLGTYFQPLLALLGEPAATRG
jgi:hypothetical protein